MALITIHCSPRDVLQNWIIGVPPLQIVKGEMPVVFRVHLSASLRKGVSRNTKVGRRELVEVRFFMSDKDLSIVPGQIFAIY